MYVITVRYHLLWPSPFVPLARRHRVNPAVDLPPGHGHVSRQAHALDPVCGIGAGASACQVKPGKLAAALEGPASASLAGPWLPLQQPAAPCVFLVATAST